MKLSKTRVKKLQSVLNAGIRFIYDIYDRNTDLIPFYKKAYILPVEKRIFFKVCLICFKVTHGLAPMYLQELVQLNRDDMAVKETRTKTGCNLLMKIPKFSKLKATNRRFSKYASESWNSLPLDVCTIDNIVSFKSKLRTICMISYSLFRLLLVAKSFLCHFSSIHFLFSGFFFDVSKKSIM